MTLETVKKIITLNRTRILGVISSVPILNIFIKILSLFYLFIRGLFSYILFVGTAPVWFFIWAGEAFTPTPEDRNIDGSKITGLHNIKMTPDIVLEILEKPCVINTVIIVSAIIYFIFEL